MEEVGCLVRKAEIHLGVASRGPRKVYDEDGLEVGI